MSTATGSPAGTPPPLPPAAVLYTPGSRGPDGPKSAVLGAFARDLADRGWRVGGVVIDTHWSGGRTGEGEKTGLDYVDLATGERVVLARAETTGIELGRWTLDPRAIEAGARFIRRAVSARADLIVVDKFGPLEARNEGFAGALRTALDAGRPVAVAVPDGLLDGWTTFCRGPSALVRPAPGALWRWWGPHRLYEELVRGVPEAPVERIVIGFNWTLVEGPDGCGLGHTPTRGTPGCRSAEAAGRLRERSLRELAALIGSLDPLENALGLAAINAHYNRRDLEGADVNGLDLADGSAGRAAVVGRFPDVAERLPGARIIEQAPEAGEYPAWAAGWILPGSATVVITGSAFGNKTLPGLLARCDPDARILLVGPSTPLAPALHAYGIGVLSGLVIEDGDRAAAIVAEGGGVRALKTCGRYVTLSDGKHGG